jgi:hypothetical protein
MARNGLKRIGWTVCPAVGGKYGVAAVLEGGTVGDGIVSESFDTKEKAQQYIDSGRADEFERRTAKVARSKRK